MFQASAVGPLGHSTFDLATCRSTFDLATCNAMRPRDMQCHAHPIPCTPFLTFVKHSAHFLCMHALEYSAPGVCLCAEIVPRWSAYQRLSGMVRVSDVPHWTKSAGSTPPRMFCLLSRAANVRARAYAHGRVRVCVCVCACIGLHEPHHSVISTRDHHRSSGNLVIKG